MPSVNGVLPILIVVGILAVAGVGMWLAYLQEKKRREALMALARELGWTFDPSRDSHHDDQYAHFEIFRRGHSRAAYNTLTGSLEIMDHLFEARMGDFIYKVTSGSGKNRRTHTYRFSYIIIHLPFPDVPPLLIRPEGLFDKLAGVFGFDDIDFESAEFSRRFHVKSPDRKFAYDVISPAMMEFLLRTNPPTVDIEHGRGCLSDGKRRWEPAEFRAQLDWLRAFFEQWPRFVKADLESRVGESR